MTDKIGKAKTPSLQSMRAQIDEIDDQLYNLLVRRFYIASKLGRDKLSENATGQASLSPSALPALRPQRENEIIKRILAKTNTRIDQRTSQKNSELPHTHILPRALLLRIWRLLMSAAAFRQNPYALAYLRSDLLCAICRGACFTPQVRLLPQNTEAEVVAILSQETQAFALVSLNPTGEEAQNITTQNNVQSQSVYPWWRFLFSTHAPRILQAMPIAQDNTKEYPHKDKSRNKNRTRVLLLGRTPNSFIDEAACTKYFIVEIAEAKSLPDEARCCEISALPPDCLLLLASHDNMLLIECRQSSERSSESLIVALQNLGKTRHIGSTHDDWVIDDEPSPE